MSCMKRALVITLALALSGGGAFLSAQRGLGGQGLGMYGLGPRLGENITLALEHQEHLQLTGDQVDALLLLQEGIREDVEPLGQEIDGLRASILAGDVSSLEGVTLLQDLFVAYETAADPYRIQVANLLSPAQHQALQGIMWETRPYYGRGLGLYGAGVGGAGYLGAGQSVWMGRAGLGLGRGAGMGIGLGRGARGMGRGLGRGGGRGLGLRWWR
jgi:hypothetical protein